MPLLDPESLADIVALAIKTATAPLVARLAMLDGRSALAPRDGRDGMPGPHGAIGEKGLAGTDGAPGPAGANGRDGKDGEIGPLGPAGDSGPQGERGEPGPSGAPGSDGPQGDRGAEGISGRDGRDGSPGVQGPAGEKGIDGLHGKDGGPGHHGVNGKDGLNGSLESLKAVYDGARTITLCFKATGEPIEGGAITMPIVLDRGVFKAGTVYEPGDGVTWAGSFWISQKDTSEKPGEGVTGWRLAVKRGADGKPGVTGEPGLHGKDGAPGRDGQKSW